MATLKEMREIDKKGQYFVRERVEEEERQENMIDKDDQCEGCGGIRAAGSNLCVNCLATLCPIRLQEIERLEEVKKELEEKVEKLTTLSNRLLDHIMGEMIYTGDLRRRVAEMIRETDRVKQEI